MMLDKPTENTGKQIRNPDPGSYLGRCISVIDLGHQKTKWNNVEKIVHKVLLNFELFGEDSQGPLEVGGKPCVVYKRFTYSNHEKSALMNDLRNWLGKVELPLQFHSLLGKYALVSVVHNSYEDKIFANISGLAQVPSMIAKTELPKGVNETFLYDMKKHPENYDLIWGWQQDMIKKSSEFVTMETKKEAVTIQDDDVPF